MEDTGESEDLRNKGDGKEGDQRRERGDWRNRGDSGRGRSRRDGDGFREGGGKRRASRWGNAGDRDDYSDEGRNRRGRSRDRDDDDRDRFVELARRMQQQQRDQQRDLQPKQHCLQQEEQEKRVDALPELYCIYDGSVSKVMDFGCFVELEGFPQLANGKRQEGLVHVSQIQNGMLRDPSIAVKRGLPCKVKIISTVSYILVVAHICVCFNWVAFFVSVSSSCFLLLCVV